MMLPTGSMIAKNETSACCTWRLSPYGRFCAASVGNDDVGVHDGAGIAPVRPLNRHRQLRGGCVGQGDVAVGHSEACRGVEAAPAATRDVELGPGMQFVLL